MCRVTLCEKASIENASRWFVPHFFLLSLFLEQSFESEYDEIVAHFNYGWIR